MDFIYLDIIKHIFSIILFNLNYQNINNFILEFITNLKNLNYSE